MSIIQDKKIKHTTINSGQHFHWYIMMTVVVVGLVGILIKGVLIFIQINSDTSSLVEERKAAVIFDVEQLEKSIEYFNINDEKHANLLITPPEVTDPS